MKGKCPTSRLSRFDLLVFFCLILEMDVVPASGLFPYNVLKYLLTGLHGAAKSPHVHAHVREPLVRARTQACSHLPRRGWWRSTVDAECCPFRSACGFLSARSGVIQTTQSQKPPCFSDPFLPFYTSMQLLL